jgi:hypothetical protein
MGYHTEMVVSMVEPRRVTLFLAIIQEQAKWENG